MATVTLDSIRDAADAKYGAYTIDMGDDGVLSLQNPMRLTKQQRKELNDIQSKLDIEGKEAEDIDRDEVAETEQLLAESIVCVADNKTLARKLIKLLNGDLAQLMVIVEGFNGGTEAGEA